ncbi:tyrosine-type recombinase/integrase [Herbaspirillum sp. NPDC101397]|uniref:tyrosine-type recombinase/integrase n=1 Tax=Herbaspirillum sp. NPDC101397 TaxID=3364006 RepID=UPI00383A6BFC
MNLPPHMRKRTRPNGKVYYFFDTGAKPRKEISLGTDFILALHKYAELNIDARDREVCLFGDAINKFMSDELPLLSKNTQHTHRSDIKHIRAFFETAPIEQIRPMHIRQFLNRHSDKPTTANRCKRLFSAIWNRARGWGYTDTPNPCEGITGYSLKRRTVYITDDVFGAVHSHACVPLQHAMTLAYLTGQRPADALRMTEDDIVDGHLIVTQEKTKQPLRIVVVGELEELLKRISVRKRGYINASSSLLTNLQGRKLSYAMLRKYFDKAKKDAAQTFPEIADAISEFWFYDLRAKAADDTSDLRGDQAASDLLGHESVRTTQRHYLRRGKIVLPTR